MPLVLPIERITHLGTRQGALRLPRPPRNRQRQRRARRAVAGVVPNVHAEGEMRLCSDVRVVAPTDGPDDRSSSFPLRRNGIGAASGSPIIMDLAGAQPALSRMLRVGIIKMRCGSPAMTLLNSTTCGAFGGGRYR